MKVTVQTPNKGTLNLRSTPNGGVVAQIPNGTQLDVEIEGEWALTSYKGTQGYVKVSFLSIPGTTTEITKNQLKKIYSSLQATLKTIEEVLK